MRNFDLLFQNFKTGCKNIGNSRRNRRKTIEKLGKAIRVNSTKKFQAFSPLILFSNKIPTYRKNVCLKILYVFRDIDKNKIFGFQEFFVNFSVSFQYFLKRFSALKFHLTRQICMHMYNSVPSVESIKLNDDYVCKNGTKRKKVKMRNFLLNYLRYRKSDQIIIYIYCNRIRSSFD